VGTINPVRIRLRYPDLDSFVEKFAPNVTRGGVFLASRNVQPVGEVIDFEIQLVSGEVALAGRGRVTWVKEFNPAEPNRPFGMGVQFVDLTGQSRAVLGRILRTKAAGQAPLRGLTGMHATLGGEGGSGGVVVGRAAGTGESGSLKSGGGGSGPNGRAPVFIDTSADLAAELGVDEAALRFALDRRRTSVGGRVDDDLSDLLRREPVETPTLAQALSDLPRLLDPQISRRRAVAGFRAQPDVVAQPAETAPIGTPETPAVSAANTVDPAETTAVTEDDPHKSDDAGAVPAAVIREPSSGNRSGRRGRRHHHR
jgi:uncharacterized protein (TIGR02266 family)